MKFDRVKSISISDTVAEEIERNILAGKLLAGNKLPPERELAEQFNVSRPSIREAINKLQAKGMIRKVPGGGNYIVDNMGASFADPLLELMSQDENTSFDILELRFAVESLSAYFAAKRATQAQKNNISTKLEILEQAHKEDNPEQEAAADVAFHLSIAEASNNPVLVHLMGNLLNVLQTSVISYLNSANHQHHESLPIEHRNVMEAILASDPSLARECMRTHIAGIERRLANVRYEKSQNSTDFSRMDNLTSIINEPSNKIEPYLGKVDKTPLK